MSHRTMRYAARKPRLAVATAAAALTALVVVPSAQASATTNQHLPVTRHVLLLSVDGMHQSDLDWYVHTHPHSALAALVSGGTEYTGARTTSRRTRSQG